jgi:hypothetical protein
LKIELNFYHLIYKVFFFIYFKNSKGIINIFFFLYLKKKKKKLGTFGETRINSSFNIYEWHKVSRSSDSPLTSRLIKSFRRLYTLYWRLFLNVWNENGRIHQRILDLQRFLLPLVKNDLVYQRFGFNRNINDTFLNKHRFILNYINERYRFALIQLDKF